MNNPLLIPTSDEGFHNIGRNPHYLTLEELEAGGFKPQPPAKAIRKFCFECIGENWSDIEKCGSVSCSLWPFRMGSRPKAWRGLRSPGNEPDPATPGGGEGDICEKFAA